MKRTTYLLFLISLFFSCSTPQKPDLKLWYDEPAEFFEESLVLGNGKMGASVFGGVEKDQIYLNDITLWAGEPVDPNMNPDAHTHVDEIRDALRNEDYQLADQLNRKLQGKFSESYAPLGTMSITNKYEGQAQNYYRELNISNATSMVQYEIDGVTYTREYFISHPDQVMAVRMTSSQKGMLDFELGFESLLKYKVSVEGDVMSVHGYAPYHAEPSYRGDMPDAVLFDENRGTGFTTLFRIQSNDGEVVSTDKSIGLSGGSEAVIYVSTATSFNGFDKDPAKEGLDDAKLASDQLAKALSLNYDRIRDAHIGDYQSFFNRVSLDLGPSTAPELATDERLLRYAEGSEDKYLEQLYFQFGRYLLISSSRTNEVPANLQGLWNPYIRPPWSSNYTVNINLEENYWLAENANLSELHAPLLTFIENVSKTGAATAKTFYGVDGWAVGHNSDIWAMSNPVGDFGQGDPVWANWNMGGAWLSTHLWEHYVFTRDVDFLRDKGYPLMKGAAQFCLKWLTENKNGHLVTSPSTSPENKFVTPEGYQGATLYGGTADLAMIRELFLQTVEAAKVAGIDQDFAAQLNDALTRLHPYQIGEKGNLQEWYYDWEDQDPQHRHQSHLFGLYPGHHISPASTPELADACKRTLEIKGDESTGWSKGWRINLWARLLDGNHAYKMYRTLLKYVPPDNKETNYERGGGTYPNLFDAHPPFQIDGNFGGAAAVVEMLMQSSEGEIRLLPALPDAWPEGKVEGICARGGFEVSMEWKDKTPVTVKVYSKTGGKTKLVSVDKTMELELSKGETKQIHF
jgi:alpha-L-fucosidase 2